MVRKGFTLIEVLLGIFLIGLISVAILPILTSSLLNINKNKIKLEMNHIGQQTIERLKSFNDNNSTELYIFDTNVFEITDELNSQDNVELFLFKEEKGENYLLKINKKERASKLWLIEVYVYHNEEGSNIGHVEYQTYIFQK